MEVTPETSIEKPKARSPIEAEIKRSAEVVGSLKSSLKELAEKLSPAMITGGEANKDKDKDPKVKGATCQLQDGISFINSGLEDCHDFIVDLINRVQI